MHLPAGNPGPLDRGQVLVFIFDIFKRIDRQGLGKRSAEVIAGRELLARLVKRLRLQSVEVFRVEGLWVAVSWGPALFCRSGKSGKLGKSVNWVNGLN